MSIIYSYPVKDQNAQPDDLLVISDSADKNRTKQIKISQLPSASGAGITLTTTGTSGEATLIGTTLNIPNYSSSLPLAADGTRGGLQIGFTSGQVSSAVTQFGLSLSNEQGFVQVPPANNSTLGLLKVGSCSFAFPTKLADNQTDVLFQVESVEAAVGDPAYKFPITRLPIMTTIQDGIARVAFDDLWNGTIQERTDIGNRTYGVQRTSTNQLVVNVPWTGGSSGGDVSSVSGSAPIQATTSEEGAVTVSSTAYSGGKEGEGGTAGHVPAGGTTGQYLDGDGTWKNAGFVKVEDEDTQFSLTPVNTLNFKGGGISVGNGANATTVDIEVKPRFHDGFSPFPIYQGMDSIEVNGGTTRAYAGQIICDIAAGQLTITRVFGNFPVGCKINVAVYEGALKFDANTAMVYFGSLTIDANAAIGDIQRIDSSINNWVPAAGTPAVVVIEIENTTDSVAKILGTKNANATFGRDLAFELAPVEGLTSIFATGEEGNIALGNRVSTLLNFNNRNETAVRICHHFDPFAPSPSQSSETEGEEENEIQERNAEVLKEVRARINEIEALLEQGELTGHHASYVQTVLQRLRDQEQAILNAIASGVAYTTSTTNEA